MLPKLQLDSIAQFHQTVGLIPPVHPLLSVVKLEELRWAPVYQKTSIIRDFYIIAWKNDINTNFRYGQQDIQIRGGSLHFMAPKQILTIDTPAVNVTNKGWLLLIHRDFLSDTFLAKKIRQYSFFSYDFNQVLPLDTTEEVTVVTLFQQIDKEQRELKDNHTKDVIIAQLGLLLSYAERYYRKRQVSLTQEQGHYLLAQLETLIDDYLHGADLVLKGIPTIRDLSDRLYISPNYLSRLIQGLTGQSTQSLLHDKLIAPG